jgi:hypothetical protein
LEPVGRFWSGLKLAWGNRSYAIEKLKSYPRKWNEPQRALRVHRWLVFGLPAVFWLRSAAENKRIDLKGFQRQKFDTEGFETGRLLKPNGCTLLNATWLKPRLEYGLDCL